MIKTISNKLIKAISFIGILTLLLNGCNGKIPGIPGGDARKFPDDPKLRVKKNLEEGRGFRLNDAFKSGPKAGVFEFASSNELWRASLDVIDFMPLASVNYSGGIIITDWYSSNKNQKENIKITIRFLTNEIRSDAIDIKVFKKICLEINNCFIEESKGELIKELQRKILKTAKVYEKQKKDKNFKPYDPPKLEN